MRTHCNMKWGLSRNMLVLLHKTPILPTLFYGAPVLTNQNTKKLESLKSFVNRDVHRQYYPISMATEVLLRIPPIDIVLQNTSTKFLTKSV